MDQPTSPFAGRAFNSAKALPPFITLKDGTVVPTELQAYCDWLNDLKFWGRWHFVVPADVDQPRRVGSMLVDQDTWSMNKARRGQTLLGAPQPA